MAEAAAAQSLEDETASAARTGSLEDLALIEEHVDSGLTSLLESYTPGYRYEDVPLNGIPDRFMIDMNQPLPQFDSHSAKAYMATCLFQSSRQVYALVCDPRSPYQMRTIEKMRGMQHASLLTLHDAQPVRLSQLDAVRLVLFLDKPMGARLSDLLANGKTFHENYVIEQFLTPIVEGLAVMAEQDIFHGRINPDHIFVDEKVVLGECLSELPGLSQPALYEPVERALADPCGKGSATSKSDGYSLAILAYEMLYGLERYRSVDPITYIKNIHEYGSYHLLTTNRDITDTFNDFFRGLLNEDKHERWGLEHIRQWLGGKRYNIIQPSLPKEASRALTFNGQEYVSLRALAQAIFRNWARAGKELRGARVDRWLEMSAHRRETAEKVERILRSTGGESATAQKLNNEFAARMIVALDPTGPLRMEKIALNVDGLGPCIAHFLLNGMHQELGLLVEVINCDLPNFWADMSEAEKTPETSNTLWKLQHIRLQISMKAIGFGMERAMYTLNPNLPCLSEMLLRYHVTTAEEALAVLDALAVSKGRDTSLLDRHLSAFLASRLEMNKEVKFHQLAKMPALRDNPELQSLHILMLAQERLDKRKLVGLATWCAMRLEKLAENIHNRRTRRQLIEALRNAAATGYLSRVLAVLVESDLAKEDQNGFTRASALYARNFKRLGVLENPKTVAHMSRDLGGRISVFISYLILGITVYVLLEQYYL